MSLKFLKLFEDYISSGLDINKIMLSYFEAAFFTEEEKMKDDHRKEIIDDYSLDDGIEREFIPGERDDEHSEIFDLIPEPDYSIENISADSKIRTYEDVVRFLELAGSSVDGLSEDEIGHDIWLTRNGHGAGFWDRGYPKKISDRLCDAAKILGEVNLVVGGDGQIHIE